MKLTLKPAGSNTSLQINSNGQLGSVSGSSYDGTTLTVSSLSVSSLSLPVPGSGTELQYRSSSTAFGAVTGSSVSGTDITLGGNLRTTSLTIGMAPVFGAPYVLEISGNTSISGVYYSSRTANCGFAITSTAGNFGVVQNDASNTWSLATANSLNSLGTPALTWTSTGLIGINKSSSIGAHLHQVVPSDVVGHRIDLANGQTADSFQIKHYNTTVLSRFLSDGQLYLDNGTGGGSTAGTGLRISNQGSTTLTLSPNSLHNNGTLIIGAVVSQMLFCTGGGAAVQLCPGGYGVVGFQATNTQVDIYRPTVITNNTVGSPVLTLTGANGQSADLFQANPYGVTAGTRARVTSAGEFSNNGGYAGSEVFGSGTLSAGDGAIGFGPSNTLQAYTTTFGRNNTMIGSGSAGSFIFGTYMASDAPMGIAIGASGETHGGIAIGSALTLSEGPIAPANTLVVGSTECAINDIYFGKGRTTHATPTNITLHGTGGSGTNIVGGSLYIAPGQSTGSGTPASVIIQGTTAGASGSTPQTLVDLLTLKDGKAGFFTSAPDKQVEINSATGDCLRLTYNDSNGSATNYADFAVSSGGNLTITPSGGKAIVSGTSATTSVMPLQITRNGAGCLWEAYATGGAYQRVLKLWQNNTGASAIFTLGWENSPDTPFISYGYVDIENYAVQLNGNSSFLRVGGEIGIQPRTGGGYNLVINDAGYDCDTRIEGDSDPNLTVWDAGTDRVGVGTNAPDYKFDIASGSQNGLRVTTASSSPWPLMLNNATYGTTAAHGLALWQDNSGNAFLTNTNVSSLKILATTGNWIINPLGNDQDTTIQGDTDTNLFVCDGGTDSVLIGTATTATGMKLRVAGSVQLDNKVVTPNSGALTIATGAITVTGAYHTVDTEAAAAADDLDTISGGKAGEKIILQIVNGGRIVTLKHNTGNIKFKSAADYVFTGVDEYVELLYNGTNWVCNQ